MEKQKVRLTEEKETLLIPLYSKALASRRLKPIFQDPKAEEILRGIEYDFSALHVPAKTIHMMAIRAARLDAIVQAYLAGSENPLVLHLGCGLDSRVVRTGYWSGDLAGDWYDLDYPDVIELRRHFYPPGERYHLIPSSVSDLGWLDQVQGGRPACIIAEGLLMYLREEQVRELFKALQTRLPGSELAFDAFSSLTARSANRHPSVKKTGAQIHWGIDDARQIESWGGGFRLQEEWYFNQSHIVDQLGFFNRFMYNVAGSLKVARMAHRILRFSI